MRNPIPSFQVRVIPQSYYDSGEIPPLKVTLAAYRRGLLEVNRYLDAWKRRANAAVRAWNGDDPETVDELRERVEKALKDAREVVARGSEYAVNMEEAYKTYKKALEGEATLLDVGDRLNRIRGDVLGGGEEDPRSLAFSVKNLEDYVFADAREPAAKRRRQEKTEALSGIARQRHQALKASLIERIKAALPAAKASWPLAWEKHPKRVLRALRDKIAPIVGQPVYMGAVALDAELLSKQGIPAVDIAGPWSIEAPKDWVKLQTMIPANSGQRNAHQPSVVRWLTSIGLDGNDGALATAVIAEYNRTHRRPSREWAHQVKNRLEAERLKEQADEQLPAIERWLEWSASHRRPRKLPAGWRYLGPGDGMEIIKRSHRDGLCLADTIANADIDPPEMGTSEYSEQDESRLFHLIATDDPKRRTVVGLNEQGIVTDTHQACGAGNKVDMEAYATFSKLPNPGARRRRR